MTAQAHAQVNQEVADFLAQGGTIQKLPSGVKRPDLLPLMAYRRAAVVRENSRVFPLAEEVEELT